MLQFMGSQRVGHDWATELNWKTVIVAEGECREGYNLENRNVSVSWTRTLSSHLDYNKKNWTSQFTVSQILKSLAWVKKWNLLHISVSCLGSAFSPEVLTIYALLGNISGMVAFSVLFLLLLMSVSYIIYPLFLLCHTFLFYLFEVHSEHSEKYSSKRRNFRGGKLE